DLRLDRETVHPDTTGQLPRLREDPPLVVDTVSRVAALGASICRRNRVSRVSGRPDLPCVTRLRPSAPDRRAVDVPVRVHRDACEGDRSDLSQAALAPGHPEAVQRRSASSGPIRYCASVGATPVKPTLVQFRRACVSVALVPATQSDSWPLKAV